MIIEEKITVRNYKCFDSSGGGFDKILPINLIIGKNNSGKSSLINLIRFIIEKHTEFHEIGRDSSTPEILIEHKLTESEIARVFSSSMGGGGIPGGTYLDYGKNFIGKTLTYKLSDTQKYFVSINAQIVPEATNFFDSLARIIKEPFAGKKFCNISAERDILPEVSSTEIKFTENGNGATNTIQQIINRTNLDSGLIEKQLLDELNKIVNPDIKFSRILVQLRTNNEWEIFFEDAEKKRIALSKMGSGVKTILLVLLNLIVKPIIEDKSRDSYVFAFEELENNLHPSMQRRLYNYIKEYSENNLSYFFLTTHSNIVIDAFGTYENSQLIHVTNTGDKSSSSTILSYNETKQILSDLGVKASDILQSNGVIWVEGPSDRNFINKWLELLAPDLKEGLHYSIMFYGGRLLSNLTFDFEWFNKEVIPLLKINCNAFVILDRDGKTMDTKINDTKTRIANEIGEGHTWITQGREIENYLSDESVTRWLTENYKYKSTFVNNKDIKIEENISNSDSTVKLKYNSTKTVFSSEIVKYIDNNSLDVLDLKKKLLNLIEVIRNWNK